MKTGKALLGLLAGVAVGATVGLLFAPDKGENTRKKIKKSSEDLKDNVTSKFNDLVDTVSQKIDALTKEVKGKSSPDDTAAGGKAKSS